MIKQEILKPSIANLEPVGDKEVKMKQQLDAISGRQRAIERARRIDIPVSMGNMVKRCKWFAETTAVLTKEQKDNIQENDCFRDDRNDLLMRLLHYYWSEGMKSIEEIKPRIIHGVYKSMLESSELFRNDRILQEEWSKREQFIKNWIEDEADIHYFENNKKLIKFGEAGNILRNRSSGKKLGNFIKKHNPLFRDLEGREEKEEEIKCTAKRFYKEFRCHSVPTVKAAFTIIAKYHGKSIRVTKKIIESIESIISQIVHDLDEIWFKTKYAKLDPDICKIIEKYEGIVADDPKAFFEYIRYRGKWRLHSKAQAILTYHSHKVTESSRDSTETLLNQKNIGEAIEYQWFLDEVVVLEAAHKAEIENYFNIERGHKRVKNENKKVTLEDKKNSYSTEKMKKMHDNLLNKFLDSIPDREPDKSIFLRAVMVCFDMLWFEEDVRWLKRDEVSERRKNVAKVFLANTRRLGSQVPKNEQ